MNASQSRNRKLDDKQRAQLLGWIAEGLTTPEINAVADTYTDPETGQPKPFQVSAQLCYQYRKDHDIDLQRLRAEREAEAITTGLAIKANRLKALYKLAAELEEDLFTKKLKWTQNAKSIGTHQYDFEEFNEAEIRQLRGVYADIAEETGGRVKNVDITSKGKQLKGYTTVSPDDWDEPTPVEPLKEKSNGKDKSKRRQN